MENPQITVLMSVYNGGKYLSSAIDSILNQRFSDFEFIIIDDGSVDETEAIIGSYHDSRIRYIKNERNIGLTKSLNRGLRLARGCCVARMDADDISAPERLAIQLSYLESRGVLAVGCWGHVIDADGLIIRCMKPPTNPVQLKFQLNFNNSLIHSATCFNAAAALEAGGYDEDIEFAQDYALWSKLSRMGDVCNVPKFLVSWREVPEGISSRRRVQQKQSAANIAHANQKIVFGSLVEDDFLKILNYIFGVGEKIPGLQFSRVSQRAVVNQIVDFFQMNKSHRAKIDRMVEYGRLLYIERTMFDDAFVGEKKVVTKHIWNRDNFPVAFRIMVKNLLGERNTVRVKRLFPKRSH